ncbi:putative tape measure protein [Pectobacterium phage vB_PatM_CB7]|nr:putative tape measure protein [Pectobacterium phage vB_PatM_CB7]
MASGNVVVTRTTNRVTFETDKASYAKAVKQIRQVGKEWEKASDAISKPKRDPAKAYDKSAQQMRLVNKRLAETRAREEKRASERSIALARREAKAKEAIAKVSAARIKQQVQQMTSPRAGMSEMKKFYQQQEREAKKANRKATTGMNAASRPMNVTRINSAPLSPRGGQGTGMVGDPNKVYNPELIAAQNRAMAGRIRSQSQAQDRKAKAEARQRAAAAARAARIDDVMAQQRIRLSSKYGRSYEGRLGRDGAGQGIQDLNRQFRAGTLSAGQYRQSIQALERQFRSAQANAGGFGAALGDIRSQLLNAGAAYGVFASGASVLKQGQFFQGMEATMSMVSDSSEEAGQRIKFVKDQAYRLGLDLKIASQGYTQMAVNSAGILSKAQNDDLFKGFSEFATASQVDPVKFQRGITAIGQMMGKGQVMAEELKGQLAEGIPGSLQVFVKAAQEAFGDTTIDVEKLMDMMQKSELKAAKILPFVGKYFAEAARKGGALPKALESNRVAMQRLSLTWIDFQNQIFQGGFGEQMTRVFRDLATILDSNGELATNLGAFFGNVIEGFWDMVTEIHDDFVLLDRIVSYYTEKLGYQGDLLKEVFDWAGYAIGIGIFVGGLNKIFKILTKIAGLRTALVGVRQAMGGAITRGGVTNGAGLGGGAGAAGTPGASRTASFLSKWKGLSKISKVGILGTLYSAGSMLNEQFIKRGDDKLADAGLDQETFQKEYGFMPKPVGLLDVFDKWFNKPRDLDAPTITAPGPGSGMAAQTGIPFPAPQKVEGDITIKIEAGELRNMVRAVVDENNQFNFNMLIQGGPN